MALHARAPGWQPGVAQRLDALQRLELAAQPADQDVDRARVDVLQRRGPRRRSRMSSRWNTFARRAGQQQQQLELGAGELGSLRSPAPHWRRGGVRGRSAARRSATGARGSHRRRRRQAPSAQVCSRASSSRGSKGLAGGRRRPARGRPRVHHVAARGEHHDRQAALLADRAAQLEAVHPGQHRVEDGGVEPSCTWRAAARPSPAASPASARSRNARGRWRSGGPRAPSSSIKAGGAWGVGQASAAPGPRGHCTNRRSWRRSRASSAGISTAAGEPGQHPAASAGQDAHGQRWHQQRQQPPERHRAAPLRGIRAFLHQHSQRGPGQRARARAPHCGRPGDHSESGCACQFACRQRR